MRSTCAILIRKVRGEAMALMRTSNFGLPGGGGYRTASLLSTSRGMLAFALPLLIMLVLFVLLLQHGGGMSSWATLGLPFAGETVVAKDARANEFRAKAEVIRKELLDPTKTFTKDEVEKKGEEIRALEARAATVAEFTPTAEIQRQGGDAEVRAANPENPDADVDTRGFKEEMEKIAKLVRAQFGGPNGYLLALAKRGVAPMSTQQRAVHDRIEKLNRTAILADGAAGSGGGEFLLPLQQVASIFSVPTGQIGLAQYAQRYPVSGRTLRIPYLIQDSVKANADGTGSSTVTRPMSSIAAVDIIGEGDEKPEREVRFGQRLLTVYKLAAYTELGDETLGDDFTGDLAPTVQRAIGGSLNDRMNEYVTADGTGSSQPLAALHANNGALLTVNRETSMNITVNDVFNMYAKHTFGGGQSFWLINRTAMPELMGLTLGNNTLVTWLPSLTGAPTMSLLGLPVIMTDLTALLGVKGDLALVNGGFYALAIRQALSVESSIHYKFRNDLTAYRFVTRFGGIPIPTGTFAYKAPGGVKQAEHSPFVVLGDDATS